MMAPSIRPEPGVPLVPATQPGAPWIDLEPARRDWTGFTEQGYNHMTCTRCGAVNPPGGLRTADPAEQRRDRRGWTMSSRCARPCGPEPVGAGQLSLSL